MAKKSLRSQLNQIRAWVRQGRTDAWIAHQLEVPATELREFRNRHGLTPDGDEIGEIDLRDEIEAEIEAATLAAEEEEADVDEEDAEDEDEDEGEADEGTEEEDLGRGEDASSEPAGDGDEGEAPGGRRRRRRRRGGRGRSKANKPIEATFDHGEKDGYGLWLDPAVADNSVYAENWKGHRAVVVQIEAEQIIIRRTGDAGDDSESG